MTEPAARSSAPSPRSSPRDDPHQVVLVEDDPGDVLLFEAAITDADAALQLHCVNDLSGLLELLEHQTVACVVLDLGLPGMTGFEALDQIVEWAPTISIVVLTGWGDAQAGIDAVARGAQDYLVKGEVDGRTIARSVRFAVERSRSQQAAAALAASESRQAEQHRLERALLVNPAMTRPELSWRSRYIAARAGVVSGDFFDGIELPDGTLRLVIGDVAGHGTDEAALGVTLRAGWRSLVLAGLDPSDVLETLEELLLSERVRGDEFVTLCDLTVAADLSHVDVRNAGHPPPILLGVGPLHDEHSRSPLGIRLEPHDMGGTCHDLPDEWCLLIYTDGLFEIRDRAGAILGVEVVPEAVEFASVDGRVDIDAVIGGFADRTDDGWRDDVAVMLIERRQADETTS